jgi:hypothetical protein
LDPIRKSNPQIQRLIVAAGLFVAWIGFLAFLAATTTQPIVLSRPQFLVSELDVIAQVEQGKDGPDPEVTVNEVRWPAKGAENLAGKKVMILNLKQCDGWQGPGSYILPLRKDKDNFVVASPPMSPGFEPMKSRPRIYRETPETLRQLNAIIEAK